VTSKARRHNALRDIVASTRVTTQAELAERLRAAGYSCTQASVSRDARELGLVKRDGAYAVPDEDGSAPMAAERLGASIAPFLRSAAVVGDHLLVVHTVTGTANSVGLFMDQAGWAGLVGTVAGDDTIIGVVTDAEAGRRVAERLDAIREHGR
jgi:transcriptional regulator of arginine metabolism